MAPPAEAAIPKVVYLVGRVHGPGKPTFDDLEVLSDEFTQQELDDLDLNGLPITIDHPPPNTPIADHPELVCGKVSLGMRGLDGSKRIFAAVYTDTPAGAAAFARLKAKEAGLSLGHLYQENRYASNNELHSRVVTGDHVALCAVPRRAGCKINLGGYELPAANLTNGADISPGSMSASSDSSLPSKSLSPPAFASSSQLVMASAALSVPAPAQMAAPAAGGVAQPAASAVPASSPMDTSAPSAAAPQASQYPIAQMEQDLNAAAKELADLRAQRAEWSPKIQAHEAELNKLRAEQQAIAAERDRLLKEQGEEKQRQEAAYRRNIAGEFRKITAQLEAFNKAFPEHKIDTMSEDQFMQTYAPDGISNEQAAVNSEHIRQFQAMSFAAATSAHNYAAVAAENEEMRRQFAGGAPNGVKRMRPAAWNPTPAGPVTPSASTPVNTSYGIVDTPQRMFNPQGFNVFQTSAQPSQHFERLVAKQASSRNHRSAIPDQKYPPGYKPPQ